jgi:hypothetical protein
MEIDARPNLNPSYHTASRLPDRSAWHPDHDAPLLLTGASGNVASGVRIDRPTAKSRAGET